ncbi:hypothetical protein J6590_025035 [Homalodisca vitripennis]|nr:hypothetical protein J6590_025035 [Homalodisca vitripennis]
MLCSRDSTGKNLRKVISDYIRLTEIQIIEVEPRQHSQQLWHKGNIRLTEIRIIEGGPRRRGAVAVQDWDASS